MAILLEKDKGLFTLLTNHIMYQMKRDRYGVLLHTFFGRRGNEFDYSGLISYREHGFSGNPHEAGHERSYSLDVLPQEYPSYGSGDYRSTALKVRYPDGSFSCELRFADAKVQKGKYTLPGLPAVYETEEAKADTLIITLEDMRHCFYVHLYYGVFEDLDLITRAVCVENCGGGRLYLENVQSACVDYLYGDFDFHTFHGRHLKERIPQRYPLATGIQSVGSIRGTSSHQFNPFLILSERNATEESGECYGFSLLYSGDFLGLAQYDQFGQTRILLGIHPDNFTWRLQPGECFYAPEVAMGYSDQGLGALSRIYHRAYRENLCRGVWTKKRRPVLLNSWEGVYFQFDAPKLARMAQEAASLGIELFVVDDGWFGKRDTDESGLGDWTANEEKLKYPLRDLAQQIHEQGMMFGIWFEPEAVSEDSDLYRSHPDWAIRIPEKAPNLGRKELLLDFSREEVRSHIFQCICKVLDDTKCDYIKWDLNRSFCDFYSHSLPSDRQGEVAHRHVLGLYDMLEKLFRKYPDLLMEGCSGGGGRFDAGMLYYTPQIWCSDDTDAIERLAIQHGTSFGYPVSTMGSHVSACPNEQTGRVTPFATRGVAAMSGTFGYELDVMKLTEEEKAEMKTQIRTFQKYYDLIQYGDYYRLMDPDGMKGYHAWQFVSRDGREALLNAVALRILPNGPGCWVRLKGLDPDGVYLVDGEKYPGDYLMNGGLLLPAVKAEYEAVQIHIVQVHPESPEESGM